jgi:hypothetical protein
MMVRAQQSKTPAAYLVAGGTIFDRATFETYARQIPQTLAPSLGQQLHPAISVLAIK